MHRCCSECATALHEASGSSAVAVAMRRRCSSASASLRSVEALPLVHDCKQLCDSRTMQRGIDYLQRATPHEQLSTAKVDLTHDGVDFVKGWFLFFRAPTDRSVPEKPAAPPNDTWVRSTTAFGLSRKSRGGCSRLRPLRGPSARAPRPQQARPDQINSRAAINPPPAAPLQGLWRNRPNSRIASKAVRQTPRRLGG